MMWRGRVRALISLRAAVAVALLLAVLMAGEPARAATTTFTVNSTGDAGDMTADGTCDSHASMTGEQCTLRAAIQEANATADADTINFSIPSADCNVTSGVCTINVGSSTSASGQSLPDIIQPVTINGYTQSGAKENDILVARDGTDAKLLIELNGANVTSPSSQNGLAINSPNVVVRGLVINRFSGTGSFIFGDGSGAVIGGNFIGTDPSGTQSQVGNGTGLTAFGGGANIIGGREAAAHNLISGNFHGLTIASNTGNTIQGNLIGTDKTGKNNVGNLTEGVGISSSNNIIGSAAADDDFESNLIAFNGDEGILIGASATGNRILNNRIYSNGKLGINLVGGKEDVNGVTRNDGKARDRDKGANNLQNYPVISSAMTEGTTTTTKGTLRSTPRKTFIIQFFSSSQKDPSGFGEGNEFIGQTKVKTSRKGKASFTFKTGDIRGAFVTATATRLAPDPNNPAILLPTNTSEFSKAVRAG